MKISIIFLAFFLKFSKSASIIRDSDNIACTYDSALEYTCWLDISNPNGRDDFETISGQHLSGFGNADVLTVSAYVQNTQNVPSVICRQFPNLESLIMIYSEIQDVTADAFSECRHLVYLNLNHNAIRQLPDNWLRNSENLESLNVFDNLISEISESAFAGTKIDNLDLTENHLESVNLAVLGEFNFFYLRI
jgi:Leucine-rich repeat (LRR) protein